MQPDVDSQPDWTETISGEVKANGKLHIWGEESHSEIITSARYVRPQRNAVISYRDHQSNLLT